MTETLTNNVNLSSVNPKSDLVTEITPGVTIDINGARLKAYFDYSFNQIYYAQSNAPNESQNNLNTFGTFEAVENWAFIDFSRFHFAANHIALRDPVQQQYRHQPQPDRILRLQRLSLCEWPVWQ